MWPTTVDALVTPYGVMLVVGLLLAWGYARTRAVAVGIEPSHVDLAVPLIFLLSIAGARLLPVVSPGESMFAAGSGVFSGRSRLLGLALVAAPALFVYCRVARLGYRCMLDLLALPAILWLACVRVGCFLAGCCWGDVAQRLEAGRSTSVAQVQTLPWLSSDWSWPAIAFPAGSPAHAQHGYLGLIDASTAESLPVHPTQLYELAYLAVLWWLLRIITSRNMPPGYLAVAAVAGYALGRFVLEFLRADSGIILANLTFTQFLCAALLAGCMFTFRKIRGAESVA